MGLWNDWVNKLTDTRDNFMRGFRKFQRSSNPLSQAMNTGIEVLMNNTGVGNVLGAGLGAMNSALNHAQDTVQKMNTVHDTTGISPATQASLLGSSTENLTT